MKLSRRFLKRVEAISYCFVAVYGVSAEAANLIVNPDFSRSESLATWTWEVEKDGGERVVCSTETTCGNMHFSNAECCGMIDSGSAASNSSLFFAEALSQCIHDVVPDTAYDLGANIRVTTDIGFEAGLPAVGISWYPTTDCSGTSILPGFQGRPSDSRVWTRVAVPGVIAPSTAHSAKLLLIAGQTGDSGSSVGMEFDSAFFGPSGTVPVELQSFEID